MQDPTLIAISPWQKLQMKILCEHLKFSLILLLSFFIHFFLLFFFFLFFTAILQCFKLLFVLFTSVQRGCHYKHPWFDDLLSRGKCSLCPCLALSGLFLTHNNCQGNENDVEPTSRGSHIQH